MTQEIIQQEALKRATENTSESNYDAIFEGFMDKGIDEDDIIPRVNIFTYNAWKAKGRQVKRGEHGVKITTVIPIKIKDEDTGEEKRAKKMKKTTVFHISQTESIN